ncbi:MAG: IS1595 family transposase [Gammaproteobacteria bacterium]
MSKSNLEALYFTSPEAARKHLERQVWPDGPVCPHCGALGDHYKLEGKTTRPGLYKCKDCREPFTVTVGTIFERSKVPLNKWLLAVYLLCSSKKGISSHQIHRTLGVTYKTAWFMTHRIREAMKDTGTDKLGGAGTSGIVEADETYYGKSKSNRKGEKLAPKQKIVALVERNGRVRAFHVPSVTVHTLKPILEQQIEASARLMTDSAGMYEEIGKSFQSHETVNHTVKEYARGDVTTNTVEGYFGILKRGIHGIYQHVSPEHLNRYVGEFSFRYNNRKVTDSERANNAVKGIVGKRLTYRRSNQGTEGAV